MLNLFKKKQGSQLAIDINSSNIALLEINKKNNQYLLKQHHTQELPPHAIVNNVIQDLAAVTATLIKARQDSKIIVQSASIALPDSLVISKMIPLDANCPKAEWEAVVTLEAAKCIPYPLHETYLDFAVYPSYAPDLFNILLVACRAIHVNTRVECLLKAGFKVHIVDTETFAKERALRWLYNVAKEQPLFIIDISANAFKLTAIHANNVPFIREETFAESDRENVISRVHRSLQFYQSIYPTTQVDMLLMIGESGLIIELAECMQAILGIKVIVANPFSKLMIHPKIQPLSSASWVMSCGLALRRWMEAI